MDEDNKNESKPIMSDIVTFLKYMGPRQEKTTKSRIKTMAIHSFYSLCMISCITPQWLVVFSGKYDMLDKAEALSIILPMTAILAKVLNRILQVDEFFDFCTDLRSIHEQNCKDPLTKTVLDKRARVAHLLFMACSMMYVFVSALFNVVPLAIGITFTLLGEPEKMILPFKTEYLMDVSENPAFAVAYITQMSAGIGSVYLGVIDGIFLSSCIFVHAQIAVVTAEFQSLNDDDYSHKSTSDSKSSDKIRIISRRPKEMNLNQEEQIRRDTEDLKTCIQHHVRLISLVDKFESVFGLQLGFECLVAAGITGLSIFQVTYSTDLPAKLKYSFWGIFFYIDVYIQFHHAQKLIDESARLLRAVSELPWTGRGRQYGGLVLQCLQRAQRPLCITGMRLYVISKETFLKESEVWEDHPPGGIATYGTLRANDGFVLPSAGKVGKNWRGVGPAVDGKTLKIMLLKAMFSYLTLMQSVVDK